METDLAKEVTQKVLDKLKHEDILRIALEEKAATRESANTTVWMYAGLMVHLPSGEEFENYLKQVAMRLVDWDAVVDGLLRYHGIVLPKKEVPE